MDAIRAPSQNACGSPALGPTYISAAREGSFRMLNCAPVPRLAGMTHYAVAWQAECGPIQAGRLDVGTKGIRLEGGKHQAGRLSTRRLLYRDVAEAKMAPTDRRLGHRPTIQLRGESESLYISPLSAGLVREILGAVQVHVGSA
jgi:hypothetical protein